MKQLLFFMGKGGVGKSTISSATALRLARTDASVLLVSLDPAHNLGDIFRMKFGDEKRRAAEGLDVIEINLSEWVARYLKQAQDEIRSNYAYQTTINIDSFFNILKYSPGTEEYAVLWAIEHIYRTFSGSYSAIIFDTPPTALTLRFIAMPTISGIWVGELAKMRGKILEKRQTVLRLNPEASVLKGVSKKSDDRVFTKLGTIQGRLTEMRDLFETKSYLSIVVNQDELSLAESIRIRDELGKLGIRIDSLCLNKSTGDTLKASRVSETFRDFPVFPAGMLPEGHVSMENIDRVEVEDLVADIRSS